MEKAVLDEKVREREEHRAIWGKVGNADKVLRYMNCCL